MPIGSAGRGGGFSAHSGTGSPENNSEPPPKVPTPVRTPSPAQQVPSHAFDAALSTAMRPSDEDAPPTLLKQPPTQPIHEEIHKNEVLGAFADFDHDSQIINNFIKYNSEYTNKYLTQDEYNGFTRFAVDHVENLIEIFLAIRYPNESRSFQNEMAIFARDESIIGKLKESIFSVMNAYADRKKAGHRVDDFFQFFLSRSMQIVQTLIEQTPIFSGELSGVLADIFPYELQLLGQGTAMDTKAPPFQQEPSNISPNALDPEENTIHEASSDEGSSVESGGENESVQSGESKEVASNAVQMSERQHTETDFVVPSDQHQAAKNTIEWSAIHTVLSSDEVLSGKRYNDIDWKNVLPVNHDESGENIPDGSHFDSLTVARIADAAWKRLESHFGKDGEPEFDKIFKEFLDEKLLYTYPSAGNSNGVLSENSNFS